jgi:hypothetical protein
VNESFQTVLTFAKDKIGLTTNKPAFWYSSDDDRVDIQIKDFTKQLALSITYEYGEPTTDFEDFWEDQ